MEGGKANRRYKYRRIQNNPVCSGIYKEQARDW